MKERTVSIKLVTLHNFTITALLYYFTNITLLISIVHENNLNLHVCPPCTNVTSRCSACRIQWDFWPPDWPIVITHWDITGKSYFHSYYFYDNHISYVLVWYYNLLFMEKFIKLSSVVIDVRPRYPVHIKSFISSQCFWKM